MFVFSSPAVLLLISVLIPVIFFGNIWRKRGGRIPFPAVLSGEDKIQRNRFGAVLSRTADFFFWISIVAFIAAAAGPKHMAREEVYLNRGADIIFVIDESPSMAAQDFKPGNRFEAAKTMIASFIENRKNNYIGLVTFGEEAELQLPPTKDYGTLLARLKTLRPGRLGDETAIGLGIGVACSHLQYSRAPERIIVLLTDGENNAGDVSPLQAAEIASALDTTVYTCGIGRRGETAVEYDDPETGEVIRGTFTSYYNEQLLQDIAERTGGVFFSAPTEKMLKEMFEIIDRIESEHVETGFVHREYEKFKLFLIPGLLLLFVSRLIRLVLLREIFI